MADNDNKINKNTEIVPMDKQIKELAKERKKTQKAGYQLPNDKVEQIIADLTVYTSVNYVANKNSVSWHTADDIQKRYENEITEFRENKKKEFADEAWQSIKKALKVGDRKLDIALKSSEKADDLIDKAMDMLANEEISRTEFKEITKALSSLNNFNIRDISTYIGTLVDKHELLNGNATERVDAKMSFAELARKADQYAKNN